MFWYSTSWNGVGLPLAVEIRPQQSVKGLFRESKSSVSPPGGTRIAEGRRPAVDGDQGGLRGLHVEQIVTRLAVHRQELDVAGVGHRVRGRHRALDRPAALSGHRIGFVLGRAVDQQGIAAAQRIGHADLGRHINALVDRGPVVAALAVDHQLIIAVVVDGELIAIRPAVQLHAGGRRGVQCRIDGHRIRARAQLERHRRAGDGRIHARRVTAIPQVHQHRAAGGRDRRVDGQRIGSGPASDRYSRRPVHRRVDREAAHSGPRSAGQSHRA